MSKIKWSQFPSSGAIRANDQTVGLRSGTNVRFSANLFEILSVDNITLDGNTISSTNTNGAINLTPAGTGNVTVTNDAIINTLNIGLGGGSVASNTRIGVSALAANTTGARNVAEGFQASQAHTTANDVTAIGCQALLLNTVSNNTAVGSRAMDACTTGTGTAVGSGALGALTTGLDNAAVGTNAGLAVTVGNGNTFCGSSAGGGVVTGSSNVAVGQLAMNSNNAGAGANVAVGWGALANTTQSGSVAVGWQSMTTATSGARNTAVGRLTLQSLSTGTDNTVMGYDAGRSTTGSNNSAFGSNALFTNTSGASNAALGDSSLTASTTASFNAAIGSTSGSAVTTGGNNAMFGAGSGVSGATGAVSLTTGTNNTMLGYRASSNAADSIGVISIGADAVADKATGSGSGDNGPGIAIGSAARPVGFRGDGTIYPTSGASAGYLRVKINGSYYRIQLFADS